MNEFNHFEGNMNIFQPAIDITETEAVLKKLLASGMSADEILEKLK